ncbi:hypothetical protein LOD99_14200 [Oopsacas minuta]|uniref:Mos1 transposase HTH domain-containing protein n=1 Tax=Oopsacas minuta TaxID=111878 RepID=A0AAV7KGN5_9METZ|nr:hypothetical protein LOD99_14200 [Oopsacas minuta]
MDFSREGKLKIICSLSKKGNTGSYILCQIQDIFGDECHSKATIYRWIERFDNCDEELHDDPRPCRPTSSKTRSNIERVQTILDEDRRTTLRELEERVGMSKATLHSIITEYLEMSRVTARWIPKLISKEQKRERVRVTKELLSRYKSEKNLLHRIVTGDETWFIIMNQRAKLNRSSRRALMNLYPSRVRMPLSPPYSPDLAPSDHWLFGEMKRPLRGKRFEDFKRLKYEVRQWKKGTP